MQLHMGVGKADVPVGVYEGGSHLQLLVGDGVRKKLKIPCPDQLGRVVYCGQSMPYQMALDKAYRELCDFYPDERKLWDLNAAKAWGKNPATENQLRIIQRKFKGFDVTGLSRLQASQILNRIFGGGKK